MSYAHIILIYFELKLLTNNAEFGYTIATPPNLLAVTPPPNHGQNIHDFH